MSLEKDEANCTSILKTKSQFDKNKKESRKTVFLNSDSPPTEVREAPDKLEEEWRESFQARQRRRSTSAVMTQNSVRLASLSVQPRSPNRKGGSRKRLDSFDYCKCDQHLLHPTIMLGLLCLAAHITNHAMKFPAKLQLYRIIRSSIEINLCLWCHRLAIEET